MAQSLSKVVLSIDLGSTSLRAGLMRTHCTSSDREWIKVPNPKHRHSSKLRSYEWPIKLFLEDSITNGTTKSIWRNGSTNDSHEAVSAKYAILWLAKATELREQYCVIEPLYKHNCDGSDLDAKLTQGLLELFRALRAETDVVCDRKRLEVEQIVLTIPSQWIGAFQDIYISIVSSAFFGIVMEDAIHFVKEVEGIAHYTFRDEKSCFWETQRWANRETVLFLDFGGHSLNYCLYVAKYNALGGMPNLYLDGESKGCGGGSEHWEYFLIEEFKRLAGLDPCLEGIELSEISKIAVQLINNQKRGEIGPGCNIGLWLSERITLTHDQIMQCFRKAFKRPLEIAEEQIRLLKKKGGSLVIITGGSSLHGGLQDEITGLCQMAGLGEAPMFLERVMDAVDTGLKVYTGAAYAISKTITARDFMARGATLALQHYVEGGRTYPLVSKASPVGKLDFEGTGNEEWRIICDPSYDRDNSVDAINYTVPQPRRYQRQSRAALRSELTGVRRPPRPLLSAPPQTTEPEAVTDTRDVDYRESYDIAGLGRPGRGPWRIEASLSDPKTSHQHTILTPGTVHECSVRNTEMCLQIKIWHRPYKTKQMVLLEDLFTSLQISEGSQCAHLEIEEGESNYLQNIFERGRKPISRPQIKRTRARRRKGFQGVQAHKLRTTRQGAPKDATNGAQIPAAPLLQDDEAHSRSPSLLNMGDCPPHGFQIPCTSAGETMSQEAPVTQHDVTFHSTSTASLDQATSSWVETLGDSNSQHSPHGHCTAMLATIEENASNACEMDGHGDDFRANAMSLADSGNDNIQLDTVIHEADTCMHDETGFLADDHAELAGGDASLAFRTLPCGNCPENPLSAQDDSDSAREFSHVAPKYQTLHNPRVPEPNMGLPLTVTLYEEILGAQFAPAAASTNPPSSALATIGAVRPSFSNPSMQTPFPPPSTAGASSAITPTTALCSARSTSTMQTRAPVPSSGPEYVDLTTSPAGPRKPRHTRAIRGGRGGQRHLNTVNPLRPIKHK